MTAKSKECKKVWNKFRCVLKVMYVCLKEKDKCICFQVREWREFEHLTELPCLEVFLF